MQGIVKMVDYETFSYFSQRVFQYTLLLSINMTKKNIEFYRVIFLGHLNENIRVKVSLAQR